MKVTKTGRSQLCSQCKGPRADVRLEYLSDSPDAREDARDAGAGVRKGHGRWWPACHRL